MQTDYSTGIAGRCHPILNIDPAQVFWLSSQFFKRFRIVIILFSVCCSKSKVRCQPAVLALKEIRKIFGRFREFLIRDESGNRTGLIMNNPAVFRIYIFYFVIAEDTLPPV